MSDHHTETRNRTDSSEIAFRKIFIGGLSYSTDEDKLKKYFKAYGSVQDAVVMKDPISKRSRGFGFITFYDVSSVDNALAHEPHTIDSRKVEAKRSVPRSEISKDLVGGSLSGKSANSSQFNSYSTTPVASPQVSSYKSLTSTSTNSNHSTSSPTSAANHLFDSRHHASSSDPHVSSSNMDEYAYNKIFVGGLHYDTRDADFRQYFEKYGKVISAEVMFNRETHKSRGFGFIVFELEQSAVKVCAEKEHVIDGKVVEVKRAIPRSRLGGMSPSTTVSTGSSKSASASPGGPNNIASSTRQDVSRLRAMSVGSAVPVSLEEQLNLLGGAGGLTQQQQQKLTTLLPPTLIGNSSLSNAIRKPYNSVASLTPRSVAVGASYAAALKLGSGNTTNCDITDGNSSMDSALGLNSKSLGGSAAGLPSIESMLVGGSGLGTFNTNSSESIGGGSIDLQSLLYNSSLGTEGARPFRSYSEPIVKFDNNNLGPTATCASLNGDVLVAGDLNLYGRTSAISRTSNNSSRSSSLYNDGANGRSRGPSFDLVNTPLSHSLKQSHQTHSDGGGAFNSLSNISWLSSPSSLGVEGTLDSNGLLSTNPKHSNCLPGLQLPSALGGNGSQSSFGGGYDTGSEGVTPNSASLNGLFGLGNTSSTPVTPQTQAQQKYFQAGSGFVGGPHAGNSSSVASPYQQQQSMTSLQALHAHQLQQQNQLQQQHLHQLQAHQAQMNILSQPQTLQQQLQQIGGSDSWASNMSFSQQQQQRHEQQVQQQHANMLQQQHFQPHNSQFLDHKNVSQQQQQYQQSALYSSTQQQQQQSYFQQHHNQQQQQNDGSTFSAASLQGIFGSPQSQQTKKQQDLQAQYGSNVAPPPAFPSFQSQHNQQQQQQPSLSLSGLGIGNSSQNSNTWKGVDLTSSEKDDIFSFKELHLDSVEFDPKAPWLYTNKH